MAEYSSLKVPELKKLLAEKGLPQTGNKADLIARLIEDDMKNVPPETTIDAEVPAIAAASAKAAPETPTEAKKSDTKEDEIDYTDDDEAPAAATKEPAPEASEGGKDQPAETTADAAAAATEPAPEPTNYAIGLSSSVADEEAKKRADRAKRFGIEEDDDAKKRAERAQRFGLDEKELASGLDSALPERPLKRGRGRGGDDAGGRPGKRQSMDRRGNGRRRGGRPDNGPRNGGGRSGPNPERKRAGGIMDDPTEKAKAEKRAARFASG
jgi:SAP domain-containing ribonucleoprotein